MSVFKAREWWSTQCSDSGPEELGPGCMAVGNLDNEPGGKAKLAVGTFNGMLRVYKPSGRDFRPQDLQLEQQMGAPILQLGVGVFSSHSTFDVQLAVLHPKRLCVYGLTNVAGDVKSGGGFYQLSLMYKHNLTHSAFNFCYGPFGKVQGKDYIAIQSLDGELLVIEQERVAFSKFLPNFLVPGPIAYAPFPVDGFVTVNSELECQVFRYGVLSTSSAGELASDADKDNASKRAKPDWSTMLGESSYGITIARHTASLQGQGVFDIVVLGEHSIFWLDKNGNMKQQKRLDYIPTCIHAYPVKDPNTNPSGPVHNLLVGTSTGSMVVYDKSMRLVWAAQLPAVAMQISVCTVGNMKGLVASVGDAAELSLCYMGTDPPSQVVQSNDARDLNYDNMEEEHRHLLSVIREATSETRAEPSERLVLRAQVPTALDERRMGGGGGGWENVQVTVKLFVSLTGGDSVGDVTVSVLVPAPFSVGQPSVVIQGISGGGTPRAVPLTFGLSSASLPTDLDVTIMAHYNTPRGEPRTASTQISLPLAMCGKCIPPVKTADFKYTLDTNRGAPPLPAIFEDLFPPGGMGAEGNNNVISFQYHGGGEATILVSKNSGRYRVQGGSLDVTWLLGSELARRLSLHFANVPPGPGEEAFEISCGDEIPITEYFAILDVHHAARLALRETHDALAGMATLYRATQKRLLVRYKDRNPAPLNGLDALLTNTYESIIDSTQKGQQQEGALAATAARLGAATQQMLLIMRYKLSLDDEMFALLKSHWSPQINDGLHTGWEESTELALTYLLKTVLGKGGKDAAASLPQGPITKAVDTQRLKKQMMQVCDRLTKRS